MTHALSAPRTVWLASFPKSGNTWLRAIVTALGTHPHLFGVDHLGSGAQPHYVGAALQAYGLDPRWLDETEIDLLRAMLILRADSAHADGPLLRKTHERYRHGFDDREPFPASASRAAILLVRDPRDVACSYAPFFGLTREDAIDAIARDGGEQQSNPALMQTAQPWGTWSTHAESWLASDVPFPVHLVRYEDLKTDAANILLPVFAAIGLECTSEKLRTAVDIASFERLKESEVERGFRETSSRTEVFFRRGIEGGWRDELTAAQVAALEADHAHMMKRLGYEVMTSARVREPLRESRASARRQSGRSWLALPAELGLDVREGHVPTTLPDAEQPRPWIQITPRQVLIRLRSNARLLVSDGTEINVDWSPVSAAAAGDGSWLVQGWGVTLAMLQRGYLSLHAATVEVGTMVVAVAGDRGAGKSTTAMGLRARGHRLLCDDVTLIEFRDDGAWTTPYSRNVHLLEDAADAIGVDFASLPSLGGRRSKVAFRAEDPPTEPRRIDLIAVVTTSNERTGVRVDLPTGAARMSALLDHTRRDGIAPIVLGQEAYFAQVARLADTVPIAIITRPTGQWTLDAVLDAIEATA